MKFARFVFALLVVSILCAPLMAGPNKGEGAKQRGAKAQKPQACPAAMMLDKMTEKLTLTAEQKTQIEALKKEYGPKLAAIVAKSNELLTPEQKQARAEAAKAAKQAGKKGPEMREAVDAAVKLTDEQKAKQAEIKQEMQATSKELREKVMALLTAEQKQQIKPQGKHGKKAGEKVQK